MAASRGLGSAAWSLGVDWLLGAGGMRKLRVIERSGMTLEARHSRQFLLDGEEMDVVFGARYRKTDA
jgi:hypothetical protein